MARVDTTPEIAQLQAERYASMTAEQRVLLAFELSEAMFEIAADGIRARHPDYDALDVSWALRRIRLGDELLRAVWPLAPLVDP